MSKYRAVLIICAIGLILRLMAVAAWSHFYGEAGMTAKQAEMARELLRGDGFAIDKKFAKSLEDSQNSRRQLLDPEDVRLEASPSELGFSSLETPGVAVLLAATWKLYGTLRYPPFQVIQAIADTGCISLLFLLGRKVFSEATGLVAAGLYSLLPGCVFRPVLILDSQWALLGILAALTLWVTLSERPYLRAVAVGVCVGIFAYARSNLLLVPFALYGADFLVSRSGKTIGYAAIALGVAYLVFVPWVIRGWRAFDRVLIFGRTGSAQNMWEGFGEIQNHYGPIASDEETLKQVHEKGFNVEYGTPQYDDVLRGWIVTLLRNHPGHVVRVILHRLPYTLVVSTFTYLPESAASPDHRFGTSFAGVAADRSLSEAAYLSDRASMWIGGLVFLLSLWGAWIMRPCWRKWISFAAVAALWWIVHLPFGYQIRVLLPGLIGTELLLGAAGLCDLASLFIAQTDEETADAWAAGITA
jgi:hypothetical protein